MVRICSNCLILSGTFLLAAGLGSMMLLGVYFTAKPPIPPMIDTIAQYPVLFLGLAPLGSLVISAGIVVRIWRPRSRPSA